MTLNQIAESANYVTDEEITSANILSIANACISEVNMQCSTALPFFEVDDLTVEDNYAALPETWIYALCEPYYAYAIMANDGDSNSRDFHYNRFKQAVNNFRDNGIDDITSNKYKGSAVKMVPIDVSDVTVHWKGWI